MTSSNQETNESLIELIKSLNAPESNQSSSKLYFKDEGSTRLTNYVGWSIKTETYLRKKKVLDTKFEVIKGKEEDALDLLISCISEELLEVIPKTKRSSFDSLWKYLPTKCKIGNSWDLQTEFESLEPTGVDMDRFCETMDIHIAKTERAGGEIPIKNQIELLMKRAQPIFYKDVIKDFRKKIKSKDWEYTEANLNLLKDALQFDFENTPEEVRMQYEPKQKTTSTANSAHQQRFKEKRKKSPIPESEHCGLCKKHRPEKPNLAKSHREPDCFFGDKPGFDKKTGNKTSENYSSNLASSPMYLDTGCSNGSFTKDKPNISFTRASGIVETANNSYSTIKGKGKMKIGSVEIDTKWVPSFQKNLINDSDVLKHNKYIIITKNRFAVLNNDSSLQFQPSSITASGTRQPDELLAFDQQTDSNAIEPAVIVPKCNSVKQQEQESTSQIKSIRLHRALGHAGESWINRTIENEGATGLPKRTLELSNVCEICATTKGRQGKVPKISQTKYLPGEAFAIDSQGPFRTKAYDGTTSNMKIIDKGSGYIEYLTVRSANAKDALSLFNSFTAKMERRTNRKVKYVYTDDGKEFLGVFLHRLDELGVVKRKGLPYDHHNPGKVERAHQTIMQLGRAMQKDSKLPLKYYPLCHSAAVYISNRLVHSNEDKTPYELTIGKRPDLSDIVPFGSICFVTLPPEKRDGKLSDTGFKERLVGYGDDDGLEEVKGYHILKESDQSLHWVSKRNTKFDLEAEITYLPGNTAEDIYEEGDDIHGDPYYTPSDDEPEANELSEDPSGTTINDNVEGVIEQEDYDIEIQAHQNDEPSPPPQQYPNTRSRRLAMTPSEINQIRSEIVEEGEPNSIPSKQDDEEDEWFNAEDSFSTNHSWFNPLAPHAKFRVNFARGAAKLGISPDLLFATFLAIQDGVAISYEEAMKSKEKDLYIAAMQAEVEGMSPKGLRAR